MNSDTDLAVDARTWLTEEGFDVAALDAPHFPVASSAPTLDGFPDGEDLHSYSRYIVPFSGGKDSTACVLLLLEAGIPRERIELHHHLVDGREGRQLMDWPVTEAYCKAVAHALGLRITFSWRKHGFRGEMLRANSPTAPVLIPKGDGYVEIGGQGPLGTRRKFPQVCASLQTRWCSSSLKIEAFDRYLTNDESLRNKRTLVIIGERAEESSARAKYMTFEPHRSDRRNGKLARHIDAWRAVHGWREHQVWDIIRRWSIVPHPAYNLGAWSRASCAHCIFGNADQWANSRIALPDTFAEVAAYEHEFGVTIHRSKSVIELADAGRPYPMDPKWLEIARSTTFTHPVFVDPWILPPGAFGKGGGPT